jgi:hypothetical protein
MPTWIKVLPPVKERGILSFFGWLVGWLAGKK